MVEKIEIQKGFAPISSTTKVRNVKKQNSHLHQRRFQEELQEEEKKKNSEGDDVFDDPKRHEDSPAEKNITRSDGTEENETDIKGRTVYNANIQGKLIDIIV